MFLSLEKAKHLTPLYTLKTDWSVASLCLGCAQPLVSARCLERSALLAVGSLISLSCCSTWVLPVVQPVSQ